MAMISRYGVKPKASSLREEVKKYLDFEVEPETDLLVWWRTYASIFPTIGKLARATFSTPASSAESERAFSTMSGFLTVKRSNLEPTKVDQLCTVHDNFEYIRIYLEEKFGVSKL
jgi:hAT family C-terminal dimerisation region